MTELRIEVTMPAPIDEVWQAFRDPELIRQWHGWEYDGLDAEIAQIYGDGTVVEKDGRLLHIGGHRFVFEALGAQTVVRVTRAKPLSDDGMDWDAWYDDVDEGWLSFLQQLRFAMARQPGRDRHTIHLDGRAAGPTSPAAALGLDVDGASGEPYAADIAGEPLTGEVWFRSPLQLGVTVDAWGPGLLILATAPNTDACGASATLSIYGVDAADDREREERWRAAWSATYAS